MFDRGGGVIVASVSNLLPEAADVFLNWSWGGVNGLSSHILKHGESIALYAVLPPGFDAALEIGAKTV
jgi:hypothetical protein